MAKLLQQTWRDSSSHAQSKSLDQNAASTLPADRDLGVGHHQCRTRSEELEDMKTTLSRTGLWKGIAKPFWGIIKLPIRIQQRLLIRLLC